MNNNKSEKSSFNFLIKDIIKREKGETDFHLKNRIINGNY